MANPRLLSHSEIDTALTCWARHAFAYTGHLTDGDALAPREIPLVLSEGRAHGAAVARWHQRGHTLLAPVEAADALRASLDADELEMREKGLVPDVGTRVATEERLLEILGHYVTNTVPFLDLTRLEDEIIVPIPSRTGVRGSSRYRFQCFIDGWTNLDGRPWLVEFKLRRRLHTVELISNSRQLRWYAWALRQAKGVEPVGVLVDETWNQVVQHPRVLKDGRLSHAKQQYTTSDRYLLACEEFGVDPVQETVEHFDSIVWHQRVPILFRDGELDEAGRELVSAAQLIRDLDSGQLTPVRHVSPMSCNGCRYKAICANPDDDLFVDTQFERVAPKRNRNLEVVG